MIAARKIVWGLLGQGRNERPILDPPPRCHLSSVICSAKRKWPKNTFFKKQSLLAYTTYAKKGENNQLSSLTTSAVTRPLEKNRRYFWLEAKWNKNEARGHLCVTHEVKAKHDAYVCIKYNGSLFERTKTQDVKLRKKGAYPKTTSMLGFFNEDFMWVMISSSKAPK